MTAYHLRRIRYPRLLFVVAVVGAFTWLGFRPGGTEVGDYFGTYGLARFWALITPMVLLLVTPMIGGLWNGDRLQQNWRLAQADSAHARKDRLINFLAGYLACVAVLAVFTVFAVARIPWNAAAFGAFLAILLIGPLAGLYITMAIGYLVGVVTRSAAARFAVIAAVSVADLANVVYTPVLSLSGTTRVAAATDAWAPALTDPDFTTALPSTWFWLSRIVLCGLVTLALITSRVGYRMDLVRAQ